MFATTWGLGDEVVGAIIVIVGGLIVWGLTEGRSLVVWWWHRPRLHATVADPLHFHVQGQGRMRDGTPSLRIHRKTYLRVRVRNEGKSVARNCRAWLVGIDQLDGGVYRSTEYADSIPLHWSFNPEQESVNLAPGVSWHIDVISYDHEQGSPVLIHFRKSNGGILVPRQFDGLFSTKGQYRYRVQVSSDDAEPLFIEFEFRWTLDRKIETI